MTDDNPRLPARRLDAQGRAHIDGRAILALAVPLVLNSFVQSLLGLTDTWFIGRLSAAAMAAMGAIYFLVLVFMVFLGGVSFAAQTLVAQAYGAGRYRRASATVWTMLYASLCTVPAYALAAFGGDALLAPFALAPEVQALALEYWRPRLLGGVLAGALWGVLGFFNGIGRTRVTLAVTLVVAVANAVLNQVLMFELGYGMAGAAWATNLAQGIGLALALWAFLRLEPRRYRPLQTWRPQPRQVWRGFRLGVPMALVGTVDLAAASLFQLMQVSIGVVEGAATQIAMMLTSLAYSPGWGLAMVGTTLVGQSIGAGDRDWAARLGNRMILVCLSFMGGIGLLIALAGPWLVPLFVADGDPATAQVVALACTLLWIGAGYQLFDGLQMASSGALRGAGDANVPSLLVLVLAFGLFLPLTHSLTYAPEQALVGWLPALGYGTPGGWVALLVYVTALGIALFSRWRSGAWRRIRL